jgi:hypothetical protein
MGGLARQDIVLPRVEVLQVVYEVDGVGVATVLPPALALTIPAHLSVLVTSAADGPHGPFRLAEVRVGCRTGLKSRSFLLSAVIDNEEMGEVLRAGWGYRCLVGQVALRRAYDRVVATAAVGERLLLGAEMVDPEPLAGGTVKYPPNLNLTDTPAGRRLVQVDADYSFERIDRGSARLSRLDASAFGHATLRPTWPVVATLAVASLTLHPVRWLCHPDDLQVPAEDVTAGRELVRPIRAGDPTPAG